MRIIGISGSPRGGQSNTRRLVERVLEGAQKSGAEVELIDLGDVDIACCVGCSACHISGECSRKDEFNELQEKILAADGLVLGSPVYFDSVTAQLKAMIDRLSGAIHCQAFLGKYACSVATAGSPELDETIGYMNHVLVRLGCNVTGGVGAAMSISGAFDTALQNAGTLGSDLVNAINEKRTYEEQEAVHTKMRERFKYLVTVNKDNWPYEYNYWKNRNWL